MSSRVRVCAAINCDGQDKHMFKWPTGAVGEVWTRFVSCKRAGKNGAPWKPNSNSYLCYRHFTPDMFGNYGQYCMQTEEKMRLQKNKDAIPTIQLQRGEFEQLESPRKVNPKPFTAREKRVLINDAVRSPIKKKSRSVTLPPTRQPPRLPAASTIVAPPSVTEYCTKASQTLRSVKVKDAKVRSKPSQYDMKDVDNKKLPIIIASYNSHRLAVDMDIEQPAPEMLCAAQPSTSTPEPSTSGLQPSTFTSTKVDPPTAEQVEDEPEDNIDWDKMNRQDPDWFYDSDEECDQLEDDEENHKIYGLSSGKWYDETKYIVSHSNLMELLNVCERCSGFCNVECINRSGAYIKFQATCTDSHCGHTRHWSNSNVVNRMPVINILLSAIILFSGALPTQILRALSSLAILVPSTRTFFDHQKNYLHGIIRKVYHDKLRKVRQQFSAQQLHLNGDGRFDSPGHSALYGIYTFMDSGTSLIVASEVIKSTETTSSVAMEKEGFIRCRRSIEASGVGVSSMTTDQHIQIKPYIRDNWEIITHYFDLWHIAKGIRKKVTKLANSRVRNKVVGRWANAIITHLYKVVSETECNTELRKEWWTSVTNHICDIHEHPDNNVVTRCFHPPLDVIVNEEGEEFTREFLGKYDLLASDLRKIIEAPRLITAIQMAGRNATSELESYHSYVNRMAPKMQGFSYSGMISRIQLTVLHHNENCQRSVKVKKDGTPLTIVVRSKANKLAPRAVTTREDASYDYMRDLFHLLEDALVNNCKVTADDNQPPTLASTGPSYSSVDEVKERHQSRGLPTKPHYTKS